MPSRRPVGPTILLVLAALSFIAVGLTYTIAPQLVRADGGIALSTDPALNEIRAIYGGLELGIGVAFLWTLQRPSRYGAGLVLAAAVALCAGLARLYGMVITHSYPTPQLIFLAGELIGGAAAWLLMSKVPSQDD